MELPENVLAAAAFIFLAVILFYKRSRKRNTELEFQINDLISRKQSLSTKYGRMTEQFMPFLDSYPYDKQNFRFIGSPIDGVQFEKDKIVFVEFKAGDHQISLSQKSVKNLVDSGKVEFREFRIK